MKRTQLIIGSLGAVILILIVALAVVLSRPATSQGSAGAPIPSTGASQFVMVPHDQLTEIVDVDAAIKINSFAKLTYPGKEETKSSEEIVCNVTIKNISANRQLDLSALTNYWLTGTNGKFYGSTSISGIAGQGNYRHPLMGYMVSPGQSATGDLLFTVVPGVKPAKIELVTYDYSKLPADSPLRRVM